MAFPLQKAASLPEAEALPVSGSSTPSSCCLEVQLLLNLFTGDRGFFPL